MAEFYKYTHTDSSITTLRGFLNDPASIGFGLDVKELLGWEDNGSNNAQRIKQLLVEDIILNTEVVSYLDNFQSYDKDTLLNIILPIGVTLVLEINKIDSEKGGLISNQVSPTGKFTSFLPKQLLKLYNDPEFKVERGEDGVLQDTYYSASVWVWSRGLSVNSISGVDKDYSDKIINISKLVTSIVVNVSDNGGNFKVNLHSPYANISPEGEWTLDTVDILDYEKNEVINHIFDSEKKRLLFEEVLQKNDVVFIKLNDPNPIQSLFINRIDIPGNNFDMIGMIDKVTKVVSFKSVSLSITGRDLVKLLIDDEVHFYPFEFIPGGIFANATGATKEKLLRFNGQILSRFQSSFKTIENTVKFILNNLSTLSITSDTLFEYYGVRRSSTYQVTDEQLQRNSEQQEKISKLQKEIIELIKLARVKDELGKITPDITENSIANSIYDFLSRVKEEETQVEDESGNLIGWEQIEYKQDIIKKDTLPFEFGDYLYRKNTAWRDGNGNIISDEQRLSLIREAQRVYKKWQKKAWSKENSITKEELDRAFGKKVDMGIQPVEEFNGDAVSDSKDPSDFEDSTNFMRTAMQLELEKANVSASETTQQTAYNSVSPEFAQKLQERRGNEIDKLQQEIDFLDSELGKLLDRYRDLQRQLGQMYVGSIPMKLSELLSRNKHAYLAIQKTWEQLRLLRQPTPPPNREYKPMNGIWQIVKFVIDESAAIRRIADSSIGNEHGSILNGIRKICQEPLVEFFTDTYGDQFYLIIRKPPFDRESVLSYLDGVVKTDDLPDQEEVKNNTPQGATTREFRTGVNIPKTFNIGGRDSKTTKSEKPLIIDIRESDIENINLFYSDVAYSWYHLKYNNLITGHESELAFAYLRALFFPEYADIYGSSALQVTTSYTPYLPINDKDYKLRTNLFIKQSVLDYQYIIQTYAHLPFTREGTITIRKNRLIKRGTYIRLVPTGEIFYVDNISNSLSKSDNGQMDGTTTLNVFRGMREKYIRGVNGETTELSYFNVIDTSINPEVFNNDKLSIDEFIRETIGRWKVNSEVFKFFLKRQQWA